MREVDREATVAVYPLWGPPPLREDLLQKDLSRVAAELLAHAVSISVADWRYWLTSAEVNAERRDGGVLRPEGFHL